MSPTSENDLLSVAKNNSSSVSRLQAVSDRLNSGILKTEATAKEDDLQEDFRPHILHKAHEPVPIAMINRRPKGREWRSLVSL